jgi:hypothetical protein
MPEQYTTTVIPTIDGFSADATADLFVKLEKLGTDNWNGQIAVAASITAQFRAWKANATGKQTGIRSFIKAVSVKWTTNFSMVQRAIAVSELDDAVQIAYLESLKSMTDATIRGCVEFSTKKATTTTTAKRFSAKREGKAIADKAVKAYGKDYAIKALEEALAAARAAS